MGITTKTGNRGKTSLFSNKRVSKDDARVEVLGELDELCSFLGMSKNLICDRRTKSFIETLQKDLFVIGAEVAQKPLGPGVLKKSINQSHVRRLDQNIKAFEARCKSGLHCFCLPGENFSASVMDVSRAIARRVERRVVTLSRRGILKNPFISGGFRG